MTLHSFRMTRRAALSGLAAGSAAAVIGAPALRAQAREPLTVMTPFGFIPDFIEMMNAVSGGHYTRHGFDAKLLGAAGTAQALQQLAAGQVQFIRAASIDMIRAAAQGVPVVAIATSHQGSTFHMISPKEKPITRAEDLKGKTVGIVSVGGTTDIFLNLVLAKVGLKPDDVKREVTGNSPGVLQMVRQGRVDCFMASIIVPVVLQRNKEQIEVWSTDRYAPMPSQCYLTTREMIEKRPETVVRFLRAMRDSMNEMLTQPNPPIFERAARDFDIPGIRDLDTVVAVSDASKEQLWLARGRENLLRNLPDLWATGLTALRETGLANPPNPDQVWTNRFIDEALKA
ncbi:MAG: ABC transporter substrate-binding protein [Hyphomicrobiales bacterium]|nr:ABC transporter substrate-binding protein [Hyphomicrobiales bacterium]